MSSQQGPQTQGPSLLPAARSGASVWGEPHQHAAASCRGLLQALLQVSNTLLRITCRAFAVLQAILAVSVPVAGWQAAYLHRSNCVE